MAAVTAARAELQELGYITPETLDRLNAEDLIILLGDTQ